MPKLSRKGIIMPKSPIRKLVPYAEQAKEKGRDVIHLNIGQPDIPSPKVALDALKNANIDVLTYSHSAGNIEYREAFANSYKEIGVNLKSENVLVTTGGSEALIFAINSITDPGDELVIPEPFYANYNGFASSCDVAVKPVISKIEDNFSLPPISEFEEKITKKTKAIIICNPNNPTGYLYSKDELEQLKDIVIKHDLFLIADEVYRDFCYDGAKHVSVLSFPELDNNAIVIDSVSKKYSMCGARVGAIVSKNVDLIQTALKFAQARLSPPSLGQIVGHAALETPQLYFDNLIKEFKSRRDLLVDGLNSIDGVICPNPKGAFYCMPQLPVDDSESFSQWLLSDFSINNQTVMMAPGKGFYSKESDVNNQVRIAYVLNKEKLDNAINILAKSLDIYLNK